MVVRFGFVPGKEEHMLGDFLIALTILTLFCLFGSGDRTDPYDAPYTDQNDDLFDE